MYKKGSEWKEIKGLQIKQRAVTTDIKVTNISAAKEPIIYAVGKDSKKPTEGATIFSANINDASPTWKKYTTLVNTLSILISYGTDGSLYYASLPVIIWDKHFGYPFIYKLNENKQGEKTYGIWNTPGGFYVADSMHIMSTDSKLTVRYGTEKVRYKIKNTEPYLQKNQPRSYACDTQGNIFMINNKNNLVYALFPTKPKPSSEKVSADKAKSTAMSAIKRAKNAIQTATMEQQSTDTMYGETEEFFKRLPRKNQKGSINPKQYSQTITTAKQYIRSAQTELVTANSHIKSGNTLYNTKKYDSAKTHYVDATSNANQSIQNINKAIPLFNTITQGCKRLTSKIRATQRTSRKIKQHH
jgi:hypothetical protein